MRRNIVKKQPNRRKPGEFQVLYSEARAEVGARALENMSAHVQDVLRLRVVEGASPVMKLRALFQDIDTDNSGMRLYHTQEATFAHFFL